MRRVERREARLERMVAKLGPTHPDVRWKRAYVDALRDNAGIQRTRADVAARTEGVKPGGAQDTGGSVASPVKRGGGRFDSKPVSRRDDAVEDV